MLVENDIKQNDVVSMKLTSGEEIVGRYAGQDSTSCTVKHPMVLIARQEGLGLAPFMFSVKPDNKFRLTAQNILCIMLTEEELAKQYSAQTSGLIL